jgi:DNA-binding NarL/FixJ family response regulator
VTAQPLRVAIVEDIPLFRNVLEETFEQADSVLVVLSVGTCREALALIPRAEPDVLLLDLNLPDGFGLQVGLTLRQQLPHLRIIVLSEHVRPQVLTSLSVQERGYWSYLVKTSVASRDDLLTAVQAAASAAVVDPTIRDAGISLDRVRLDSLSEQQRVILSLVAAGASNGAIAEKLNLSNKGVEYHLSQIYSILEVPTDSASNPRVHAASKFGDRLT